MICKKLLSLLDHTRIGQPDNSRRQAHRCGDACYTPCELTEKFGRALPNVA